MTTRTTISPGRRLRDAAASGIVAAPGAFNALTAKMIERAGFRAAYLSGAAFSAGTLGVPDIGLFTLSELTEQTRVLARATALPLIVDADVGFGEAVNVERTVIELEAAGAAAIQLEDQQLPKRCGHLSGKSIVSVDAMCAKIRAAASARRDPDLVILARTDARGVTNYADAVERAQRYIEAGADWVFPEAMQSPEEFASIVRDVPVPLVANMTEFGKSPLLSVAELDRLGYAAVLFPVTLLRTAMFAVEQCLQTLAAEGTQQAWLDKMQSRQELYDLIGYQQYEDRDREYFQRSKKPTP